jgi:hypothetical protein
MVTLPTEFCFKIKKKKRINLKVKKGKAIPVTGRGGP